MEQICWNPAAGPGIAPEQKPSAARLAHASEGPTPSEPGGPHGAPDGRGNRSSWKNPLMGPRDESFAGAPAPGASAPNQAAWPRAA